MKNELFHNIDGICIFKWSNKENKKRQSNIQTNKHTDRIADRQEKEESLQYDKENNSFMNNEI